MISITCTHCRAHLTIDDAFAGGVCRCQYCGTIQTVPAKGKAQVPGAAAAASSAPAKSAAPATSKTLYKNTARSARAGSGTGLDDLANAVVSSGLTGSGLSSQRHTRKSPAAGAAAAEPGRRNLTPILLVAAAVIVVLLGVVVYALLFRGGHAPGSPEGADNASVVAGAGTANFCGIPLHARSTIFLLDRGNSISDQFDMVKAVCFKAVTALGPNRQFQVILWDNESSGPAEFPVGQMADATTAKVDELRRDFQDSIATGRSHLSGALKEAAGRNPQEIVIVTAKGADDLDDDDSAALQSMIGQNIRIDAVQVYAVSPSPNKTLQEVSRATGGQYRNISAPELRDLAH